MVSQNSGPLLSSSKYSHINTALAGMFLLAPCGNNSIVVMISAVSKETPTEGSKLSRFLQSAYRIRKRSGGLMERTLVFARIPTKHRTAKSRSGRAERMRSHRQPRVGITNTARRTSNTVPMAQKTCQQEKKQSQSRIRALSRPPPLQHCKRCSLGTARDISNT